MPLQIIEGDVLLRDANGNPITARIEGKTYQLGTSDQSTHDLLVQVLYELKKLNLHLSLVTGEKIENCDVA